MHLTSLEDALEWPWDIWSLVLQCRLVGIAQEVCATLTIDQSLHYDIVRATELCAYELVPEAYKQRFHQSQKAANQTFVESTHEKSAFLISGVRRAKLHNGIGYVSSFCWKSLKIASLTKLFCIHWSKQRCMLMNVS